MSYYWSDHINQIEPVERSIEQIIEKELERLDIQATEYTIKINNLHERVTYAITERDKTNKQIEALRTCLDILWKEKA